MEVVAGTAPYVVRLATTRTTAGEDEVELAPGESAMLRSADVAWGETIDGRLEYAARDGSGVAYTDELLEYTFTRPTREDCEAVAAPTGPTAEPSAAAPVAGPGGTSDGTASDAPAPSATAAPSVEASTGGPAGSGSGGPTGQVGAGDTVTLEARGFLPGELVIIQLRGSDAVLGTATAGADGTVTVDVRIPAGTGAGVATVDLWGNRSEVVAPVELRVAGSEGAVATGDGIGEVVPLTAAAAALVVTVAGLVSVAGARRSAARHARSFRHA